MIMKKTGISALIAVFFALLLNCSVPPAEAQSGGTQRNQDRVSREVYHELVMLPQLSIFDNGLQGGFRARYADGPGTKCRAEGRSGKCSEKD